MAITYAYTLHKQPYPIHLSRIFEYYCLLMHVSKGLNSALQTAASLH